MLTSKLHQQWHELWRTTQHIQKIYIFLVPLWFMILSRQGQWQRFQFCSVFLEGVINAIETTFNEVGDGVDIVKIKILFRNRMRVPCSPVWLRSFQSQTASLLCSISWNLCHWFLSHSPHQRYTTTTRNEILCSCQHKCSLHNFFVIFSRFKTNSFPMNKSEVERTNGDFSFEAIEEEVEENSFVTAKFRHWMSENLFL